MTAREEMGFPKYKLESELCADFIAWARAEGYKVYPETGGFDVLLADAEGRQTGVEAKLRLNVAVICQALRGAAWLTWGDVGPDYRAILVPDDGGAADALAFAGLTVFEPLNYSRGGVRQFRACSRAPAFDWNPAKRLAVPPVEFDAPAGVPSPSAMTPWKVAALRLIALLETRGYLTRQDFRDAAVSPTRWMTPHGAASEGWLIPGAVRGQWVRGTLPRIEETAPEVYASILAEVRRDPTP